MVDFRLLGLKVERCGSHSPLIALVMFKFLPSNFIFGRSKMANMIKKL